MFREQRFWDRVAKRYAASPVADQAAYEEKLRRTQAHLQPDMRVLEFGCGTGTTALIHAAHVAHIDATDISSKMLDIAREKAHARGVTNVSFSHDDFNVMEIAPGSYDAVMANSILHLLPDRDAALAKIYQGLKPGGRLFSSTACMGDNLGFFRLIGPVGHFLKLLPLLRIFTKDDLISSMEDAGFNVEDVWQPAKNKGVFAIARKPE